MSFNIVSKGLKGLEIIVTQKSEIYLGKLHTINTSGKINNHIQKDEI